MVIISIKTFTEACSEHMTLSACVKERSRLWSEKDSHNNFD